MDSVRTIIQSLLASLGNLTQPQQKFLVTLFSTLLISCGRATFRYVVSDGFYSKVKWVEGVTNLKLEAIGKLRRDANLRYLYHDSTE